MRVFDNMDREQADMYRWIRQNMSESLFFDLTGKQISEMSSTLDIDRELREAYVRDRAAEFVKRGVEASKIKIGILPPTLGKALLEYSEAYAYAADFQEGLGGLSHGDVDSGLRQKFLALCEEISKLRF